MKRNKVLQRASGLVEKGDTRGALNLLVTFLGKTDASLRSGQNAKLTLYLAALHRLLGEYEPALDLLTDLMDSDDCEYHVQMLAFIEASIVHRQQRNFATARALLRKIEKNLPASGSGTRDARENKTLINFYNARGLLNQMEGMPMEAAADFGRSLEAVTAKHSVEDSSREFVPIYLNLYNTHMVLGNQQKAREYLYLAHARILTLKSPDAYCLISLFENLATYNLFVVGSQHEAIRMLSNISEEVVTNFADFRRVFDFFSSIIVQLHSGKISLEQLRDSIRDYGDDPLIKAYLPTLLYGAPPPGTGDGDDDIPEATLVDD